MNTKIENYYLDQPVNEAPNLKEFTDEEYISFASAGGPRTLSDEKFYEGENVNFNRSIWTVTIGANKGLIYNIALQITDYVSPNIDIDAIFKSTLEYLIDRIGKYDEHSWFSKKYIWYGEEANVTLDKVAGMGHRGINLIFTSRSIRDEVIKSLGI